MKLAILSDLHLECSDYTPPPINADAVALIGDISAHFSPVEWAKEHFRVPVLFVPGNHDYYGKDVENCHLMWKEQCEHSNVSCLVNESVELNGVRFVGTPLWSDLRLLGESTRSLRDLVERSVQDFRSISLRGRPWTINDHIRYAEEAMEYLNQELSAHPKSVVLTHFAPHPHSIHPKFKGDPLNPYFINYLPELVELASAWVHGHTHSRMNYRLGDTDIFCHPRGYATLSRQEIEEEYLPLIIDIPSPNPSFVFKR